MSSNPPPSVPIINSVAAPPTPPEEILQNPGGSFSADSQTPRPSQTPGNNITSPVPLSRSSTLLQTPPITESQSRPDREGYFSPRKAQPTARHTRTTSSNNHSAQSLSPGLSSGGSFNSSETGQSPCSYSSGEFLSPPQRQGDGDKPPYIPRRSSSDSLSMIKRKLRRVYTIPNDKKIRIKRRHRRRNGCRHHKTDMQDQHGSSYWGESSCQVAPTAPTGERQLCRDHTGHSVPRNTQYGSTDTFGRLVPQSMPGPSPQAVARRWSSVENASHQIGLQSTLHHPPASKTFNTRGSTAEDQIDRFLPKDLSRRYRSSSFTRGAIDHDIVRAVRERLTVRKIPTNHAVEPPLSITLRRASGISGISGLTRSSNDHNYHSDEGSRPATLLTNGQDHLQTRQLSAAYLITSEDIDSIALLIAKNVGQNLHSYDRNSIHDDTSSTVQSSQGTRTPTMSNMVAKQSEPLAEESTINVTDFQPETVQPSNQGAYLQVNDFQQPVQRSNSDRSMHEIIWDGSRKSTTSFGSSADERKHSDSPPESETSPELPSEGHRRNPGADKGDAFDPDNAQASISEWSWRLPQNDITMVVTSSDSDSTDITPRTEKPKRRPRPPLRSVSSTPKERMSAARVRPFPRYAASQEQLQDVVSFPPLNPRKTTSDWFSPLPDMETESAGSSPPLTTSRSLYGLGVDMTAGPSGSVISRTKAPFTSWVRSAEVSPSQSPGTDFRPDYGFGSKKIDPPIDTGRRKSVIKPHPKAIARTGHTFAMGSSIGAHTSERRRSSAPRIKRVRTIDNVHKGERDEPPSRWRPPSICPPRLSESQLASSPAESEESKGQKPEDRVPEMMTRLHRLRSGITDRISLVEARCPPLPKSDCAGIYGAITGTLRRSIAVPREDESSRHECDDCANDPRRPSIDWIG